MPTLRNNQILAGVVNTAVNNAKNSIGVQIVGPNAQGGPLIEDNRIVAGADSEAGIVLGRDYPRPIVEHAAGRRRACPARRRTTRRARWRRAT